MAQLPKTLRNMTAFVDGRRLSGTSQIRRAAEAHDQDEGNTDPRGWTCLS